MPAKKKKESFINIFKAFLVSAFGTGLSRLLGAGRDIVITHFFGASKVTDSFWIAWTIPLIFRRFVADEGLTGALIPAVAQEEKKFGTIAARQLTDKIFTVLVFSLFIVCVLGILAAPYLVYVFALGFTRDAAMFNLTVTMTRWLFPFLAMVSLVSYCEGILNHRNHFFIPKIAPGIVSAAIMAFVILFFKQFHPPIFSLVTGVLVGGIFHFLIQLPIVARLWFVPRFSFSFYTPRVKFFLGEMGKVIIIGVFAQLNVMVLRFWASFLAVGSVTHYWNANRMIDLAHGIIVVGMGSVLMPVLARSVADGDWENAKNQFEYALKMTGFFLIPASFFIVFFNRPMVCILFCHGSFTFQDCLITAATLQLLSPFLLCLAGINIVKKVYFAINDRNTLLLIGGFGVALTAITGIFFIGSMKVKGLAVALSLSSFVQLILYLIILKRKIPKMVNISGIKLSLLKMIIACLPFSLFLHFMSELGEWQKGPGDLNNLSIFIGSTLVAIITYLAGAYFLKLTEVVALFEKLKRKK